MERLLALLNDMRPEVDFNSEKALIDDGIIDSSEVIELITDLEDEFDIEITMDYIQPRYFNSAEAMWTMIQELRD